MPAVIMDGKALALKVRQGVKEKSAALGERGVVPCLAVVHAGDNPASVSYVKSKEKALAEAEMKSLDIRLPADVTEEELLSQIGRLNRDAGVHGILVQMPLPKHINEEKIISALAVEKDVDCFHHVSAGKMLLERGGFLPCTPYGILELLREYGVPIAGSHAVIAGRSNVGKPLANLLLRRQYNATVTVCHTGTRDMASHTLQADILIAAAGKPCFIKPDMVKEGAAVIDVGINRVPDPSREKGYFLCGDVDPAVAEKAAFYSPVPGGVGPMTIAMLLKNVLEAAENTLH
jgi:methylenetetrahydrofolate dehydrogenase (NADP+)/methenyltetrahydrofolate cyclohydrolase